MRETTQISLEPLLYDETNIDQLDWPDTEEGNYAKRYLNRRKLNAHYYFVNWGPMIIR